MLIGLLCNIKDVQDIIGIIKKRNFEKEDVGMELGSKFELKKIFPFIKHRLFCGTPSIRI